MLASCPSPARLGSGMGNTYVTPMSQAVCDSKDIIGISITGDLPGLFITASGVAVEADMLGVLVRCGIHYNKIQPEILAGLHDSYGDFAPVRYEDFAVHINPVMLLAVCRKVAGNLMS